MPGRPLIIALAAVGAGAVIVLLAVSWFSDDTYCAGFFKSQIKLKERSRPPAMPGSACTTGGWSEGRNGQ